MATSEREHCLMHDPSCVRVDGKWVSAAEYNKGESPKLVNEPSYEKDATIDPARMWTSPEDLCHYCNKSRTRHPVRDHKVHCDGVFDAD